MALRGLSQACVTKRCSGVVLMLHKDSWQPSPCQTPYRILDTCSFDRRNIAALLIRKGFFWAHYTIIIIRNPQNSIGNYKAPKVLLCTHLRGEAVSTCCYACLGSRPYNIRSHLLALVAQALQALPPQLIPIGVAAAGAYLVGSWLCSSDTDDLRSELSYALRSPGHFQQFVQELVPHRVPSDVLKFIEAVVRGRLGGQAYLKLEGSAKKHTNIRGSDHDCHVRVPDGWFRSARDQMEEMCPFLNNARVSHWRPTWGAQP